MTRQIFDSNEGRAVTSVVPEAMKLVDVGLFLRKNFQETKHNQLLQETYQTQSVTTH